MAARMDNQPHAPRQTHKTKDMIIFLALFPLRLCQKGAYHTFFFEGVLRPT